MKKLLEFSIGKKFALSLAFLVFGSLLPLFTYAQDVILNPGYIGGTISITGQTISSSSVYASGSAGSASTSTSSGSYTLTVNVPQGSSADYSVSAYSYFSSGGYLSFPSQSVTVYENATTTANFNINPGLIQATITATSGTVSGFYLYAYGGGTSYSYFSGSSGSLPVVPSSSVTVYGTAYFTDGGYASLSSQTVSVGAGGTVAVSWTVSPPPPTTQGTISGTIQMNGATADQHYVYASGPSYASQSLSANGPYTLTNLNAGSYGVYAYSYFNNYASYLYHPYSSYDPNYYVTVTGGQTTNVDISTDAAFVNGTLKLTGTKSLSQTSYAYMAASGAYQTNSYGGWAATSPNLQTGAYSLVVSEGSWSPYYFNFYFYNTNPPDPSDYLYEYVYFYDYQSYYNPIAVAAGETVTKNLTYGTGSVTVNFSILGGGTLSNPSLNGSCYKYDGNNQLQSYYYFYSYGYNQSNVSQGSVSFVGMEGACTFDAYAYVGGSYTKFGTLTLNVIPGSQQEIDIGGPSLTITFPEPDYITSNPAITVTGTASDDVAVDSVTVNGFSATTDPSTPAASISFEASISLNYGPNQIQTVATDTSGKTGSDTRTVYRDEGPPTLNWTPADGSSSSSPNITVHGTATDDAGIGSITINGVEVTFQSTNNPSDPNEVSFSVPLTLPDGDNFIEIVAIDISNRSTTQTHKVTVGQQDTTPPETSISLSGVMGSNGWFISNVTVSLSATDEPGGSGVAFTEYSINGGASWSNYSGPFDISSEGMTTIYYRSQDNAGNLEATKSVGLKIDKTPPTIIGYRNPAPNANGWNNTDVTVSFSCSDGPSGVDSCSSPTTLSTEGAGQSVIGTAVDLAGNTASVIVDNINIDKTPPTIIGSRNPAPNANGWNNTDVTVSFSCSDGPSGVDSCSFPTTLSTEGAGQSVTGTAVDLADNTASTIVDNINIDKTSPSLTGMPAAGTCTLWPPNHKLVSVATVVSNDGLSSVESFSVIGESNEPENGIGDGDTAPDIVITGGNVQLRSERSGNGTGRIYTLVATATDEAGNSITATSSCSVRHDQRKK